VNVPDAPLRPFPFVQLEKTYCLPEPPDTGFEAVTECVEPEAQVKVCGSCEYVYVDESIVRTVPEASLLIPLGAANVMDRGVACQFQVILEAWFIVKVVVVLLPDDGTFPVPVQPIQV